jgi:hypothetical protein
MDSVACGLPRLAELRANACNLAIVGKDEVRNTSIVCLHVICAINAQGDVNLLG